MASGSTNLFVGLSPLVFGAPRSHFFNISYYPSKPFLFSRVRPSEVEDKISNSSSKSCRIQDGLVPVTKWHDQIEILEDDIEEEAVKKASLPNEIKERIHIVRSMLGSMNDGEISISAYDTAWVALIEDTHGSDAPQFPSALQWIANNQLPDGSWGDAKIFSVHDRLINTLACVVALKSWNIDCEKCQKGLSFFNDNISKLENENDEHMPIGFEIAFPSLLEIARGLGIEVPEHSPVLKDIYAKRNLKLTRIPKDTMYIVPTTLLHSLEGMQDLNWEKLLELQFQDGSFLFSLSSTAYAFMQTKDENCLKFLTKVVQRFNTGVPSTYPVDLFEHLWVVDRLQRLGILRYFQTELEECMHYVYRYWTEKGISWARNSKVQDIDDTAMGFRLLRLHGYEVSADVFQNFEKGGEFFCFGGQSTQAVTGIFNLFRASQVLFPGEKILENAKQFSAKFLREKLAENELQDKWIITKDLNGEVDDALKIPWYASLPRVEARLYIEQYGGEDDIWIGKTFYRMPYVNNNIYLELAKLDYNSCQALHQTEWDSMERWYTEYKLDNFGIGRRALLLAYFVAAASIYEPERWQERIGWAKTSVLLETITSYFHKIKHSKEHRRAFVDEFRNCIIGSNYKKEGFTNNLLYRSFILDKTKLRLTPILLGMLNKLSMDVLVAQGREISNHLHQAWEKWLIKWQEEGDGREGEVELLVHTINLIAGNRFSDKVLQHTQYRQLSDLTNRIFHILGHYQKQKVHDNGSNNDNNGSITILQIEYEMQELAQLVLQHTTDDIDSNVKHTFLTVIKSFYYIAYYDTETINFHTEKVLFERVD